MFDPNAPRPPLVEFELRVAEVRDAVGQPIYSDVHFVKVTPHGSKDRIEKRVEDWFYTLEQLARDGRFPLDWLKQYKGAYEEWKATGEIPVEGTALRNWPLLTPAELKRTLELGLRSVEDLAAANEQTLERLGMGGRGLKQKAKDWVTAQTDSAPLVSQLGAQRTTIQALEARLGALEAQNSQLQGLVTKLSRGAAVEVPPRQQIVAESVEDSTFAEMDKTVEQELS